MKASEKLYEVVLKMVAETKSGTRAVIAIDVLNEAHNMVTEALERVYGSEKEKE